jgi:hypothetical protein
MDNYKPWLDQEYPFLISMFCKLILSNVTELLSPKKSSYYKSIYNAQFKTI